MSSTDARARPVSAADRRRPKEFPVAIGPASYLRVVAEICRLGSKDHVLPTYLIDVRNPQALRHHGRSAPTICRFEVIASIFVASALSPTCPDR